MERRFEPIIAKLLTCDSAKDILNAYHNGLRSVKTSFDLQLSTTECLIKDGYVLINGDELKIDDLEEIKDDERSIYLLQNNSLSIVEIRAEHYYKLVRTERGHAPTLEIDGIHMHRIFGTFPEKDAEAKVRLVGSLKNKLVIDTCMGLGYTAISAIKMKAKQVITVERDENVYGLARINPWSWALKNDKVVTVISDVAEFVSKLDDNSFDVIIHDPPRISLAGELYSSDFYHELCRILKPSGRIVHYVGSPGKHSAKRIHIGVMNRMRAAGFRVYWDEITECVYGYKAAVT
ncbi:MAG: RsmD family RNA methyltransferase [Nitrososphaerota archaeon]